MKAYVKIGKLLQKLKQIHSWLIWLGLLAGLLVPLASRAQVGYPEPDDLYLNDFADLVSSEDAENIRSALIDLRQIHDVEGVVVTIDSIADYGTGDETIESFATNLFNTWGIGDSELNNGVLVLVAVGDRQVRIELGAGYGHKYDGFMQSVIDDTMLPNFRGNNYSRGIYQGVLGVIAYMTGERGERSLPSPVPTASSPPPPSTNTEQKIRFSPVALLTGGISAAGAALYGLGRFFRYRKRDCPHCQFQMVRLDEVADDVHLDSGQKVEEYLKSVDYDVWNCPHCGMHTIHAYRTWLSSFKVCPKCHYRTLSTNSQTIQQPTYTSTGRKRITRDCRHCKHHDEDTVILPMLVRSDDTDHGSSSSFGSSSSSSSSSSSFSGGSSSGGGASGKW